MAEPISVLLGTLAMELGPKAARFIGDKLNSKEEQRDQYLKYINEGLGVTESLKKIYGDQLDEFLKEAKKNKKIQYESVCKDYISIEINRDLPIDKINNLLKIELAENLERLNIIDNQNDMMNEARGIVNKWLQKYVSVKHIEDDEKKKIKELMSILKSGKKTAKDVFKQLRPLFGASSALTIIYAGMLATGTAVGFWAGVAAYFNIIPVAQVFGLAGLAILLTYLAVIPIKEEDKIQLVINGIYGLIDNNIEDFSDVIKRKEFDKTKMDNNTDSFETKEKNTNFDQSGNKNNLLDELDKKIKEETIDVNNLLLIISLLKYTILIDNNGHLEERKVFVKFMKDNYNLTEKKIMKYYKLAPVIEDIEDFLQELSELLSQDEIKALLLAVKEIIIADGEIHEEEVKLMKTIDKYLNK